MITRIVKMTFKRDKLEEFQRIFERSKGAIRDFEGCLYVELCRDTIQENVYFTYSQWVSEDELNAYRNSPFFKSTWNETKELFEEKAEAHSLEKVYSSEQKMIT